MAEYIDREAVNRISFTDAVLIDGEVRIEKIALVRDIEKLLAADVTPVRHGRWVEKEKYTFGIMYDCSLCENRILDNGHTWNYCPNCGCRMDGGDDE